MTLLPSFATQYKEKKYKRPLWVKGLLEMTVPQAHASLYQFYHADYILILHLESSSSYNLRTHRVMRQRKHTHTPLKSRLVMWSFYNALPYLYLGHLQISCCPPTVSQFGWRAIISTFQVSPVGNPSQGVGGEKGKGRDYVHFLRHSSTLAYIYAYLKCLWSFLLFPEGRKQ